MVKFGNIYYFMYLIFSIIYFCVVYFILKNKSKKTQYIVILSLLFMNFALHFLKLTFPPYCLDLKNNIHKITLENLCAVSVVVFPFIFLIKKDSVLHDYMFFIGFCSGLAALVCPTEALNKDAFALDTIRFYICHSTIIIAPLLSVALNIHRPKLKRFWAIPLLFFAHELIILLNEIVLIKTGLIQSNFSQFLSRSHRNNSFIFGPTPDLDSIGSALTFFTPKFMTKDIFGINGGVDFYWPILWLMIPAYVYFTPIYFCLCLPFEIPKWKEKNKIKKNATINNKKQNKAIKKEETKKTTKKRLVKNKKDNE